MNLSLIHLVFWAALVWLGWWLHGRYGKQISQAVSPLTTDPEEMELLQMFREAKAKDEAKAAEERRQAFRSQVTSKFNQTS